MRPVSCVPALVATVVACSPSAPPDTSAAAKQAIDAANANWPRLTSTSHADSLADFYAANAVVLPPNMSPMRGREAIRQFFAVMNTTPVDSGKYLVRWVNENGRWLMAQDIWNSDVALPMPPH